MPSRVGLSASSWSIALCMACQAHRKEIVLGKELWASLTDREQLLIRAANNAREGLGIEKWMQLAQPREK